MTHVSRQPFTEILPPAHHTTQEMSDLIRESLDTHREVLQAYHKVWYESRHTWGFTSFAGIGTLKSPNDLWMYQTLISELRPRTIIETGTYTGASSIWFAFLMDLLDIQGGRIYTIDREDQRKVSHPRITFFEGDSTNPEIAETVGSLVRHPLLISLDADHSADHVFDELTLYAPLTEPGEYCIVEDTNVSWPGADDGARGGAERYLRLHHDEWMQDILCERYLFTCHPGGWLRRVRPWTEAHFPEGLR